MTNSNQVLADITVTINARQRQLVAVGEKFNGYEAFKTQWPDEHYFSRVGIREIRNGKMMILNPRDAAQVDMDIAEQALLLQVPESELR